MDAPSSTPQGVDLFALFDFEARFDIDIDELDRRYLERSKAVHPDRFVNAPASERVAALQRSMTLNDAYKTLKKPLPRAEYLLEKHGVAIGDNEALDPEFLMEVLELREQLQVAKHAGDTGELRALEDVMLDRQSGALDRLAGLFADGASHRLAAIKTHVILLRYIQRYLAEFDDLFLDEGEL